MFAIDVDLTCYGSRARRAVPSVVLQDEVPTQPVREPVAPAKAAAPVGKPFELPALLIEQSESAEDTLEDSLILPLPPENGQRRTPRLSPPAPRLPPPPPLPPTPPLPAQTSSTQPETPPLTSGSPPKDLSPQVPPAPLPPAASSSATGRTRWPLPPAPPPPPLPPQPPLRSLPPDVWSRVVSQLNRASRDALRQSNQDARAAVDMTVLRLRVVCGGAMPAERAPYSVAAVERALRGMVGRGCRPRSLRLNLSDWMMPESVRQQKGRAALQALSVAASLEDLSLCGLPLLAAQSPVPTAMAGGLTRLCLAGVSAASDSLQEGLASVLQPMTRLRDLELNNQRVAALALPGPSAWTVTVPTHGSVTPQLPLPSAGSSGSNGSKRVWQPLWEAAALRRLTLNFCDAGEGSGGGDGAEGPSSHLVTAFARGLAGMTQLTSLSLGLWHDGGLILSSALPLVCGSLANLRTVELRCAAAPPNLFACLASLPRLKSLALHCERFPASPAGAGAGAAASAATGRAARSAAAALLDVHALTELTALTHMTLVKALPPAAIQRAIDAGPSGGGGAAAAAGSWGLPARLAVLQLRQLLPVAQLARMAPAPPTLHSVSLAGAVLRLPGTDEAPKAREVRQLLASVVRKLAGRGVRELAFDEAHERHHLGSMFSLRPLSCWVSELSPLGLRVLKLYDVNMDDRAAWALCDAVGTSLEDLELGSARTPQLVDPLEGLLPLRRLRRLTVAGVVCRAMQLPEPGWRGLAGPGGAKSSGAVFPSVPYSAGRVPPTPRLSPPEPGPRGGADGGAAGPSVEPGGPRLNGAVGEATGGPMYGWEFALQTFLARGVHVRLWQPPGCCIPTSAEDWMADRLQGVAATGQGQPGWGELEVQWQGAVDWARVCYGA